jgi:hypothetical protein
VNWYARCYPQQEAKLKKRKAPRAGEFGLTVEEAGAMIGLSHSAAYRAAKKGQIPTIRAGRCLVVPKAVWLRHLGIEPTTPAKPSKKKPRALADTLAA